MFGMRTPVTKASKTYREVPRRQSPASEEVVPTLSEGRKTQQTSVRRSIGEWESGKSDTLSKTSITPKKTINVNPPKPKPKTGLSQESVPTSRPLPRRIPVEAAGSPPNLEKPKYTDRLAEAKACLAKAKINLGNSRNIKTEIKTEVIKAIERLYQLVKESESEKVQGKRVMAEQEKEAQLPSTAQPSPSQPKIEDRRDDRELIKNMKEHARLIKDNTEKMEQLHETLGKHHEDLKARTYASVAAAFPRTDVQKEQTALHSIVVTAKDEQETGEQVLDRIRSIVKAKEGGIEIERIRKAKDRKVIVGCRTEKDRKSLMEKLKKDEEFLNVAEMANKHPLVIIRDVFNYNSDEDILSALNIQNKDIFVDMDAQHKPEIAYKKKTRNPHTQHVIMRVPPMVWRRMVDAGSVRIDLQRVRVTDQSPLVQCSLCLGYGHGRRFCQGTLEKCSHCGGPHMRTDCAERLAGATPSCCNCVQAKAEKADHNAFSQDCAIRRKWDALARATIAYC